MNILFVNNSSALTGAAISCYHIMTRCGEGIRPVFASKEDGPMIDRLKEQGIKSYVLSERGLLGLKYIRSFLKIIRDEKIGLVHLNTLTPVCKYAAIAGYIRGLPVVWFVRENPLISRSRRLGSWLKRLATKIVFVDRDTKEKLMGGGFSEKVEVIYNGVDLKSFSPSEDGFLRERFNVEKGAPLIGYLGLITKRKGVEHLVRAMPTVRKLFPDARLFIIGGYRPEDEQYSASVKSLVDGLSLNESVIFTGVLTEVARAINGLDVVVLPSLEERCSRTLLEAIACEKPVVATAVGGTPEIVEDGVNGLLVAPEDPEALSRAIARLLGDERLRRAIGKKGREKARTLFDIEENMGKIRALYFKISDGL